MIPFFDLAAQQAVIKSQINENIAKVLAHGKYILGPEVAELEERLCEYTGAKYCITCANGTDALQIALMAIGVGQGDEVITPAFSYIATAEATALLGAKPIYVDVDPVSFTINPALIEEKVTAKTKAIIPVSLYGQPANFQEINKIACKHNLIVIEDGAQSFGSEQLGRKSCNLSDIGCTSFFPTKPLGCYGDGGAIFTNNDEIAQACREIRVHGQSDRYIHTRIGLGGRMDTLQCAVVLSKLDRFDWEIEERQRIAGRYYSRLSESGVTTVSVRSNRNSVYAQLTVMVEDRDALQSRLKLAGLPTAVHYPVPLNEQPAYKHLCCPECTPTASYVAKRVLSLPMGPDLSIGDQDRIISELSS